MKREDFTILGRQFLKAVKMKPGDTVWIRTRGPDTLPLANTLRDLIVAGGASFHVEDIGSATKNLIFATKDEAWMKAEGERQLALVKTMQGYISICDNTDESKIIGSETQKAAYEKLVAKDLIDYFVKNLNWLVVNAPTKHFAKACGMTPKKFDRFYSDVCLVDYSYMTEAVKPLAELMRATDRVRIKGVETDLSFSIKGVGAVPCTGENNIPDGECFSAPVKESVNGTVKFGKSIYEGAEFESIKLEFSNGRIISAEADTPDRTKILNDILNRDEGARYVGEFAIAFNPMVKQPTGDILFDEKIDGSFHFTPGGCYKEAPNGNDSLVHWDMVQIQRPEYGGGEIWFDNKLIRKDGIFVREDLTGLNPDRLSAPRP